MAAGQIVQQVLVEGRNLNQVLDESLLRKQSWSMAQRAALQDLSYGSLRFYGQLRALLELLLHKPLAEQRVYFVLLVALYQLEYSKAAHHAVVNHAVRATQVINPKIGGLVNAVLRNFLRNRLSLLDKAKLHEEGKYNYPKWWVSELQAQYGAQADEILETGNQRPPMTLRVNQRRGAVEQYARQLAQEGMIAHQVGACALQLERPVPVDRLPGFQDGMVSVQDAGAQFAAELLDVHEGMRVLDACAAPGGKTAHIMECAQVEMTAVDKDAKRLGRVAQNLQRLGLHARLESGDAAQPEAWWDGKPFQRILADVPCSGSGVVRRHPDIKWLRRLTDLAGFAQQQLAILNALWPLLATEGKLLYATCSIFQQENEQVISQFLQQHTDALRLSIELESGRGGQLLPDARHDGFFYALLLKQEN